jgi:transcriptional regulator with XRE-family HTH domain
VLGAEIKQHRRRLGLSSKELAGLVGVDADTVERWESGELRVPRSVRLRLLLGRLELRHREMLSSPDGLREWNGWLDEGRAATADELD